MEAQTPLLPALIGGFEQADFLEGLDWIIFGGLGERRCAGE